MDMSNLSQAQWRREMEALDKRLKSNYVRLTTNGFVHIRSDNKTVCGLVISRYDWMTIEVIDPNRHVVCKKCKPATAPVERLASFAEVDW